MKNEYVLRQEDLDWLAQELIEDCCIDGIRNKGGRYTKVWPPERLQKRLVTRLRELLESGGRLRNRDNRP